MRWNREPEPEHLSERKVREFLIFPKTFDLETRWLEFANIREVYDRGWGLWLESGWAE